MGKGPSVDVIIPVYNRLEYICDAIESVIGQTYKNYNIIVVDDGSTEDVRSVIEPYMDKIKYLYQKNKGLPAARNYGIKNSSGKYLAFLDDDDLFEPNKLETQVKMLEENPEFSFIYSDYYYFEQNKYLNARLVLVKERKVQSEEFSKKYFLNHSIPISALLVQRRSFEEIGLFNEYFRLNEDVDMWLRLSLRWKGLFSDYPSTKIRLHDNRLSKNRVQIIESLIDCLERILNQYPNFKKDLGTDAYLKLGNLHCVLANELLMRKELTRAQKEFVICKKYQNLNYWPIYFNLFILSLGKKPARIIFNIKEFLESHIFKYPFKALIILKRFFLRKTIRETHFISGNTSWKECFIILQSLLTGKDIINGKYIKKYEKEFSKYIGVKYACSFGAGRMAFYSILKAMGIEKGDEVILPGYTCVVVPNAINYCGAKPVYVDIDLKTLNIDVNKIVEKITPRTKVLYAQHTGNSFCDMDALTRIARKYNLKVIEDCSHTLGAEYAGKKVGTFGDAAYFTTEQSKIISTGMGGMAVTDDEIIAKKIKEIQDKSEFYEINIIKKIALQIVLYNILYHPQIHFIGKYVVNMLNKRHFFIESTTKDEMEGKRPQKYPVRLSNIQAKVGLNQLRNIEHNLEHRRKIASIYRDLLNGFNYEIPENTDIFFKPSYIRYWFLVDNKIMMKKLFQDNGIELGEWFNSPIHPDGSTLENVCYEMGTCPIAEYVAKHNTNLPTHLKIKQKDVWIIIELIKKFQLYREKKYDFFAKPEK